MLKNAEDYTPIRIRKDLQKLIALRAVANKRSMTKELEAILEQVLKG
jgi:plasmid stability protein